MDYFITYSHCGSKSFFILIIFFLIRMLTIQSHIYKQAILPQMFFLAEQNFSLLGGHLGHLSKNILYIRPVQRVS